ncbi:uncharacterized protein LOC111089173 [Limulus polyphemus]|uniref:Uncharacterized protein LOC111089173 n=1 Tax=Limulus polyphemus TaxID=6850 RepID=A0ABM1TLU5_LIMPO|nr:uncharacterized protein LOC111089173 [Limulus polyphemus]
MEVLGSEISLSKTSHFHNEEVVLYEEPVASISSQSIGLSTNNQWYGNQEDPRESLSKTSKLNQRYEKPTTSEDTRNPLSKPNKLNQRHEQKNIAKHLKDSLSKTSKLNQRYEQPATVEDPKDGLSKTSKLNQRYEEPTTVEDPRDSLSKTSKLNQRYEQPATVEDPKDGLSKTSKLNQRYEEPTAVEDPRDSLSKTSKLNQRYTKGGDGDHLDELANSIRLNPQYNDQFDPLSETSRLNKRYIETKVRQPGKPHPAVQSSNKMDQLGLTSSALNDRYFSQSGLIRPPDSHKSGFSLQGRQGQITSVKDRPCQKQLESLLPSSFGMRDPDQAYTLLNNTTTEHVKFLPSNSHFSQNDQISDTSETLSLSSHVRNVHVPSQTSDLDQYLDELFNPVLDGDVDEMSDARSLAALNGRNFRYQDYHRKLNPSGFTIDLSENSIDDMFDQILEEDLREINSSPRLTKMLKRGGD